MTEPRPSTSYAGATAHYLSEDRRDAVKRHWEEPATRGMIAAVLDALGPPGHGGPLRVLDVGAGTGDALRLLGETVGPAEVDYLGIDTDPDMVETATELHDGRPGVAFTRHDVREPLQDGPFDLVLSTGVPFSHLRPDEFRAALAALFAAVPRGHRCAAVVDVLGRFSLEWTPNWDRATWRYAMSFFAGTDDVLHSEMTFHSRESLWSAIGGAAADAGARIATAAFHDRSVAVGRHTATAEFAPDVRPYRTLVNRLYDGDVALDVGDLAMRVPDGHAPDAVRRFFGRFTDAWNARLVDARSLERELGTTPAGRVALARSLQALEHGMQSGLGTAHSLSALLVVER
ncbi:class I SAM-dependent methyltransferase [Pseudonocardia endophytica]|uniref:Methyltransferase family protein n=1 Tax=Pseudonocardia endophytica TaxID=401976 RepID=A0A4R1HKM5_PSEEN|nr:class I SAM-dependent methyltransferase [Pseudonocardia endophytica]TCK21611.1 methyltransferase family protein [Pseudonocardia endophytica]